MNSDFIEQVKKTNMVFMVGHGRSGTTLLQSIMNNHPNIVAPPESEFIIFLYPHFGKIKRWTKADLTEFVNALYFDPLFYIWQLDKEQLLQKIYPVLEQLTYPLLCKMVIYEMRKDKKDILVLCDKKPLYSLFVPKLLKIFSEAKFIHLVRDPRDSVSAHIKRMFAKNAFFLARRWVGFNRNIDTVKKKMPQKFFTILYENMVNNMEGTLHKLYEFLGVTYVPPIQEKEETVNFEQLLQNPLIKKLPENQKNAILKNFTKIHQGHFKPVSNANIGMWKKEMAPKDVAIADIITAKYAQNMYGYTQDKIKEEPGVSSFALLKSKIIYALWQRYTRLRYSTYNYNKWYMRRAIRRNIDKLP